MNKKPLYLLLCVTLVVTMFPSYAFGQNATVGRENLTAVKTFSTWKVAPAGTVSADSIAQNLFPTPVAMGIFDAPIANIGTINTSTWPSIPVPGSLLGGLIDLGKYNHWFTPNNDGVYDVMFHDNITKVQNDFDVPWWYSCDFELTAQEAAQFATLNFKGISYTGRVFVNGVEIKNTNLNITNEDELKNRATSAANPPADGDTLKGMAKNLVPPYFYYEPSPVAIPSASTANRGSWADYKNTMQGSFRHYDLDVTGVIKAGVNNIKVLIARGDRSNDFNYNFHDWHMTPVDRNMGITYPVTLALTGAVRLSNPFAASTVTVDNTSATVKFYVDANNMSGNAVTGQINAIVTGPEGNVIRSFTSGAITIPANAYCYEVAFAPQIYTGNALQLWWPYLSGEQPLYHVKYEFVPTAGTSSDSLTHRFGIRQIDTQVNRISRNTSNNAHMVQILVNHKPIVMKGGGYCPTDLYLRQDIKTDRSVVDLVKMMGFNCIRDEGKFFNDNLYDIMDEEGIMLMTGYMCCDRNEARPNNWGKVERFIVYEQTYDQIRSLRAHPSMVMWLNGSDYPKDTSSVTENDNAANVTHKMLEIEGRLRWYDHGNIMVSAVNSRNSYFTGAPGGMEMDHTYDTATPTFMFGSVPAPDSTGAISNIYRGVYSFVSEGIGGAGIPSSVEGIYRMIPEDNMWPFNVGGTSGGAIVPADADPSYNPGNYNSWNYHACRGGGTFTKIDTFNVYTEGAFGGADSLEEWIKQANLYEYEMQRAQYEALNKHRYVTATGFINWMLNGTRPVIMWNQFDYDMNPHGSTYGCGKANEPVHIMYDPFNKDISVINSTFDDYGSLTATMMLYDVEGRIISNTLSKAVHVVPDALGPRTGTTVNRPVGKVPVQMAGDDWYKDSFTLYNYSYGTTDADGAKITSAPGVNKVWTKSDIDGSLIKPTSDVYFMRLELKNSSGKVLSYNTYAVPRRQDVFSGNSSWSRASISQTLDWTQLKSLPDLDFGDDILVTVNPHTTDGDYIIQTVDIKNTSKAIAHGIELKAKKAFADNMLCPALYDDNLITLFPGQTRTLTVKHHKAYYNGALVFEIDCFNGLIGNRPERTGNVYHAADPVGQTTTGTSITTPDATTNITRNRPYAINSGNFVTGNATGGIGATAINTFANPGTNVLDSDINTSVNVPPTTPMPVLTTRASIEQINDYTTWTNTCTGTLTVSLGAIQTFDRAMLRFSSSGGTNMMGGTPNYIKVQVSDDGSDWTDVKVFNNKGSAAGDNATYDNTKARAPIANIIFEDLQTAQYIRYIFTGLTKGSTQIGTGPGSVSSQTSPARANPANFVVSGVEVYHSYNYAFLDIVGDCVVTAGGVQYTEDDTAMDRSLKVYTGEELEIAIMLAEEDDYVNVRLNGELINDQLEETDGVFTLLLDSVEKYSVLSINVNEQYSITIDYMDFGTVTASANRALVGTTIDLTVTPDRGCRLKPGTLKYNGIVILDNSFEMPNENVIVTAEFQRLGGIIETDKPSTPKPPLTIETEDTPTTGPGITDGTTTTPTTRYDDVAASDWFYGAVEYVSIANLMTGTGERIFSPNVTMTRAMLVTVLYRQAGSPAVSGDITFQDVKSGEWYTDAILWGSSNGIIEGYSADLFGVNDPVTREQVVTILYRYAKAKGLDVSAAADLANFDDAGDVSAYALDAVKWAVAEGLIQGRTSTTLVPKGTSTRAEVATILQRYVENFLSKSGAAAPEDAGGAPEGEDAGAEAAEGEPAEGEPAGR